MKIILLALLLFCITCNHTYAYDPDGYKRPVRTVPNQPIVLGQIKNLFDPGACQYGYTLKSGRVGKDLYFVLDCLDNEYLETQS